MNSCLHCFYEYEEDSIVCPNCHKMSFDKYNNVKERNMKPLNSLILIKYEEPTEKKTDSGLYFLTKYEKSYGLRSYPLG